MCWYLLLYVDIKRPRIHFVSFPQRTKTFSNLHLSVPVLVQVDMSAVVLANYNLPSLKKVLHLAPVNCRLLTGPSSWRRLVLGMDIPGLMFKPAAFDIGMTIPPAEQFQGLVQIQRMFLQRTAVLQETDTTETVKTCLTAGDSKQLVHHLKQNKTYFMSFLHVRHPSTNWARCRAPLFSK